MKGELSLFPYAGVYMQNPNSNLESGIWDGRWDEGVALLLSTREHPRAEGWMDASRERGEVWRAYSCRRGEDTYCIVQCKASARKLHLSGNGFASSESEPM